MQALSLDTCLVQQGRDEFRQLISQERKNIRIWEIWALAQILHTISSRLLQFWVAISNGSEAFQIFIKSDASCFGCIHTYYVKL